VLTLIHRRVMANQKTVGVIALVTLLGAFALQQRDEKQPQLQSDSKIVVQKLQREAEHTVARMLKDPDSAKFRDVRVVVWDGSNAVCGEVNGRNGYGAYSGFSKFVAAGGRAFLLGNEGLSLEDIARIRLLGVLSTYYVNPQMRLRISELQSDLRALCW